MMRMMAGALSMGIATAASLSIPSATQAQSNRTEQQVNAAALCFTTLSGVLRSNAPIQEMRISSSSWSSPVRAMTVCRK